MATFHSLDSLCSTTFHYLSSSRGNVHICFPFLLNFKCHLNIISNDHMLIISGVVIFQRYAFNQVQIVFTGNYHWALLGLNEFLPANALCTSLWLILVFKHLFWTKSSGMKHSDMYIYFHTSYREYLNSRKLLHLNKQPWCHLQLNKLPLPLSKQRLHLHHHQLEGHLRLVSYSQVLHKGQPLAVREMYKQIAYAYVVIYKI